MSRSCAAGLMCLACWLVAATSWAEVPAGLSVLEHTDRSEAYFRAGDYQAALRELRAAQALQRAWQRIYNMAVCYERLGHLGQAIALLETFLAEPGADPQWLANGRTRLRRLRAKLELSPHACELADNAAEPGRAASHGGTERRCVVPAGRADESRR